MNMIWQGYLEAVGWVQNHPHRTMWLATAAIVVALVL